jgi:transposase
MIDFIRPDPLDALADKAKTLFDTGLLSKQVAKVLTCSRSMITKLWQHWHIARGILAPDLRARRSRLERKHVNPPPHQAIAEAVMELYRKDRSLHDIAQHMHCSLNLITATVRYWHESRGLPVPDGRTRRRLIREAQQRNEECEDNVP